MEYIGKVVKIKAVELPSSMSDVLNQYGIVISEMTGSSRPIRVLSKDGAAWWFSTDEITVINGSTAALFDIVVENYGDGELYSIKLANKKLVIGDTNLEAEQLKQNRVTSPIIFAVHNDGSVLLSVKEGHDGNFDGLGNAYTVLVDQDTIAPAMGERKLWWIHASKIATSTHLSDGRSGKDKARKSHFEKKIDNVFVDIRFGNAYTLKSIEYISPKFKYTLADNITGELTFIEAIEPNYPAGLIGDYMLEKDKMGYHSLSATGFKGIYELEREIATMSKGGA